MSVQNLAWRRLRCLTQVGAFLLFALSAIHASNLPEDAPIVISESTSTRALVTLSRSRGAPLQRVIPVGAEVTVFVTKLELIKGEGGFNTAPREYFKALMDVCRGAGIAIWDDEIQTFGRLDRMFAYEALDLGDYVDVFCVGKMTQACATLFTEEFNPQAGLLSGTFIGEGVSFRVGRRILERLDEGDYYGEKGRIARHHKLFREQVEALAGRHPKWFPKTDRVPEISGGRGGMMLLTIWNSCSPLR